MKGKLVVCYIGDRASQFIDLSLQSVIDVADKIVFVWGMEDEKTKEKLLSWQDKFHDKFVLLANRFNLEDKGMNGKQRNLYLAYLKRFHIGDWCLVLDPDEAVDNGQLILETVRGMENEYMPQNPDLKEQSIICNPAMIHFIYNLRFIDSTKEQHHCPGRMFKVDEDLFYEEVEHAVTQSTKPHVRIDLDSFVIYHLGYVSNMFDVLWKYQNNKKKSNIHKPEFIEHWRRAHLLGKYPIRQFNTSKLPKFMLDYFHFTDEDFKVYQLQEGDTDD